VINTAIIGMGFIGNIHEVKKQDMLKQKNIMICICWYPEEMLKKRRYRFSSGMSVDIFI